MKMRQIGKGNCGSVWADETIGSELTNAFKREDCSIHRSVLNDSIMHQRLERSLLEVQHSMGFPALLNIPRHRQYISKDDYAWWKANSSKFPADYEHCNTLITERILPFGRTARENIVDLFCLEQTRDQVKRNPLDEDCLVRPYLGRRTHGAKPSRFFTLRNKLLAADQIESINLPIHEYARVMADTLAVVHWHAKLDASDIEFVLAPAREGETAFQSDVLGPHRLWVLDFDLVRTITLDESGVERAAQTFLGELCRNDPYYPRPGSKVEADVELWNTFANQFLISSQKILGKSELPQMLIERIEELGAERRKKLENVRKEK